MICSVVNNFQQKLQRPHLSWKGKIYNSGTITEWSPAEMGVSHALPLQDGGAFLLE